MADQDPYKTSFCNTCRKFTCKPCFEGDANDPGRSIALTPDAVLRNPHAFRRIAIATANLGIPRREIPNWMANVIFGFEGQVISTDGYPMSLTPTAIDDALNNEGSFRWFSSFLKFAIEQPKQAPQGRVLDRLRLIVLAFQIDKPDIARHFFR